MKNQFARPLPLLVLVGVVAMLVGFADCGKAWAQDPDPCDDPRIVPQEWGPRPYDARSLGTARVTRNLTNLPIRVDALQGSAALVRDNHKSFLPLVGGAGVCVESFRYSTPSAGMATSGIGAIPANYSAYFNWEAFLVTNCPEYSSIQIRRVAQRVTRTTFNPRNQSTVLHEPEKLKKGDLIHSDEGDTKGDWVLDAWSLDAKKALPLVGGAAPGTDNALTAGFALDPPGYVVPTPPTVTGKGFILKEDYFTFAQFDTFIFSGDNLVAVILWGYQSNLITERPDTASPFTRRFTLSPDVSAILIEGDPNDAAAIDVAWGELQGSKH